MAVLASVPASTFIPIPPAREIPLTFAASLRSWWLAGEKQAAAAEERILRRLPFFVPEKMPDSAAGDSQVIARVEQVKLANPKHYLNTLSIKSTNPDPHAPPPAVVLHGYGAGIGFFFQNFPALATWAGRRRTAVYAVDWLGMGRSARVPFHVKAKRNDIPGRVHEAESFFVDSLEEWRQRMGLQKMTLIGHSLGAYFSVAYALRHPTRVNKLILLSPAGVNDDQFDIPDAEDTTSSSNASSAIPASVNEAKRSQKANRRQESRSRRLLQYLWEEGWSPFQVVRSTLFWSPMLVGKYSSRRFPMLTEDEIRDMHDYLVNITLSKGSGEYCISHILAPFAIAHMPLSRRVSALKIPITFAYGDNDWMDPAGGLQALDTLQRSGNHQGRMFVVPSAGHHLYLDNAEAVNDLLIEELELDLAQKKQ